MQALGAQQDSSTVATEVRSPQSLLDSLSATCLYRQEGLWMYEMCYKKHMRQFRHESGGNREDFSCGQYTGDEQQNEAIQVSAWGTGLHETSLPHTQHG